MTTITLESKVREDGSILLEKLPVKPGQMIQVEVHLQDVEPVENNVHTSAPKHGTVAAILASGVIGISADRDDIGDTLEYAGKLRAEVEKPRVTIHDFDW